MRDLLIRISVSALVGATISGGILYFAFDQSLRGIETAVESTNERISDNGEWLRTIKSDIGTLGNQLNQVSEKLSESNAGRNREDLVAALKLEQLTEAIAVQVNLTSGLALQISEIENLDPRILAEIKAISAQLRSSEETLRRINFTAAVP